MLPIREKFMKCFIINQKEEKTHKFGLCLSNCTFLMMCINFMLLIKNI